MWYIDGKNSKAHTADKRQCLSTYYQNTGRVWFGLQSTNFWRSYGPFIKT